MRTLGILAGVLVLLLAIWAWQRHQESKVVVSGAALTMNVDPAKVTRVQIKKSGLDVELVKTGVDWKIVKPIQQPADSQLVNGMLSSLKELKLEDVISTNKANQGTYQVDSAGTQVEVWSGSDKPAIAIVVGKSSSDWTHTYVRRTNEDKVYRAEGVLSYNFNRKPDDWRDKTILRFDEPKITRIELTWPKEKLGVTLARAPSAGWTYAVNGAKPENADSLVAQGVARNAAMLSTVTFATPQEAAGKDFSNPDFRVRVQAGGDPRTVSFVLVDDTKMLARREGSDTVYSLYKSNLVNLMKKPDELRRKAPGEATAAVTPAMKKTPAAPAAKKGATAKGPVKPAAAKKS